MKEPSEKQQQAAQVISSALSLPLPTEFTAKCYWEYISKHMDESRKATARRVAYARRWCASKSDPRKDRLRRQKEADWEATNLDGAVWAQRVLDGKVMPPSWCSGSLADEHRRLRGLGYKSSMEEELDQLKAEKNGWCEPGWPCGDD